MHPILFEIGDWPVYSYGVLLAAAYLVALQLAVVRARRRGLDGAKVMDLGIYLIIAALVGAKLMLVIVDFEYFRSQPRELLSLVRAGGVFYGGLLAALGVAIVLVRRYQLRIWTTADLFAPGIALGHVVGRLGCLMAGCCYGKPDHRAVGHHVHEPGRRGERRARRSAFRCIRRSSTMPGAELLILVFLLAHRTARPTVPGPHVLAVHAALRISRFVVEIYRGDRRAASSSGLSTSQFVSLLVVPLAIADAGAAASHGDVAWMSGTDSPRHDRLVAADDDAGCASIVFLARRLPDLSRSQIQRLIKRRPRHAGIAARRSRASLVSRRASRSTSSCRRRSPPTPVAEALPLTILYDDEDIVVIDKPAGHGRASGAPGTRAARWSTPCSTTSAVSAASAARSGRASCIGSIAARRA